MPIVVTGVRPGQIWSIVRAGVRVDVEVKRVAADGRVARVFCYTVKKFNGRRKPFTISPRDMRDPQIATLVKDVAS